MRDHREPTPEPTIEGKTFDEWLEELASITIPSKALEIANITFGLGGDNVQIDIKGGREDTEAQEAAE